MKPAGPTVLIILDGLGVATPNRGNAVTLAQTPVLDRLWPAYPHTYLEASGNFVGLPRGVVGNSEVGHMSLGAGRIVFQEVARIDHEIETGDFFNNETFHEAVNHAKENNSDIHLMGLISPGKVHASPDHLYASLEFCKKAGIPRDRVKVHLFTDGRDSAPKSAIEHITAVVAKINYLETGVLSTIVGRYFAMDRDSRWERTQKAYEMLVNAQGTKISNWEQAINASYSEGVTDEFIEPIVIVDNNNQPVGQIKSNDAIVYFNYRADRAVQLSQPFADKTFQEWDVSNMQNIYFAGFSNYQKGVVMNRAEEDEKSVKDESELVEKMITDELARKKKDRFPENQIFPPQVIEDSVGNIISMAGKSQLRLAESEKYPHVSYFFNCRDKRQFEREERIEVPSPKEVATYDLKPEMSTYEITNKFKENLNQNIYDFFLINFANTDMVAHTGNLEASIKAVEVADQCVGEIIKETLAKNGKVMITSDHGNIEELINLQTGDPDTKHSINQVPFIYVGNDANQYSKELSMGMLADIAPTILFSMGIDIPNSMTGRILLQ